MGVRSHGVRRSVLGLTLVALLNIASVAMAGPQIEKWQTSNGARVLFVAAPELPMLDIRLVFDAGSARDKDKAGMALLTNGMLSEGAGGLSTQALAENFEAVGAQFSNGALKDMAWLSLRSLREDKYLKPALANLKQIVSKPGRCFAQI